MTDIKDDTTFLRTERLILRRFTADDADLLVPLDSDPEVMRFITDGQPRSAELTRNETLPRFLAFYERYDGLGVWPTFRIDNGAFIGWFHLRPFRDDPRELELGYRLMRPAWGKGFATEGSAALIEKGFREFNAERIVAKTMRGNEASQKVMQKVGLTFEQDFTETLFPGVDKRAVLYALDRETFLKAKA